MAIVLFSAVAVFLGIVSMSLKMLQRMRNQFKGVL